MQHRSRTNDSARVLHLPALRQRKLAYRPTNFLLCFVCLLGLVSAIRKIRNSYHRTAHGHRLTEIVIKTSIGYGAKILDAALPGPLRVQGQASGNLSSNPIKG